MRGLGMIRSGCLKVAATLLIGLAVILGVLINFKGIYNFMLDVNNVQYVVNIIPIISGLSGVILGAIGYRATNLEAIREYFLQGDAIEFIKARRIIYSIGDSEAILKGLKNEYEEGKKSGYEKQKGKEDVEQSLADSTSIICNFYHMWGLMVRKGYLPIWVFEGSSGRQVVKIYSLLEPYIEEKRVVQLDTDEQFNSDYADNFIWLYRKIKRKYKYGIIKTT